MGDEFVLPRYLPYAHGGGVADVSGLSHGLRGPPVYDLEYSSDHSSSSHHGGSESESDNAYTHVRKGRGANHSWRNLLRSVQGREDCLPERIRKQPRRDYLSLQDRDNKRWSLDAIHEKQATRIPLSVSNSASLSSAYHVSKQQRARERSRIVDQEVLGRMRVENRHVAGASNVSPSSTRPELDMKDDYYDSSVRDPKRPPGALMPTLPPKHLPAEDAANERDPPMNALDDRRVASARGDGPVVNHLSQIQRREHILQAVAEVRRVFNQQVFSCYPSTSLKIQDQDKRPFRSGVETAIDSHPLWMEYWQSHSDALGPELADCIRNTAPQYQNKRTPSRDANVEPVDGDNGRGHRAGTFNGGPNFNSLAGQGDQTPHGLVVPPGGNNRAPNDRPNPDPGQPLPASPEDENGQFRCVFHNPNNPSLDKTEDCATLKTWVCQLKVHHGGPHEFFYCAECFTTFDTKAQCKAHNPKRCPKKCVTVGCQNFNTHSLATCKHPETKGKRNSQRSIHNALHQLAHQYGPIWNGIQSDANESASGVGPSTPANRRATNTLNTGSQPSASSSRSFASSTQQSGSTVPTTASSKSMCSADFWLEALQTLGCSLLKQLDDPSPERLAIAEDMYSSYMECPTPILSNQGHPHEWDGIIGGHRKLCRRMWAAIQNPDDTNLSYKIELRNWAYGVLHRQALCYLTGNSLQATGVNQYQQSPTPVVAGPSNQTQPQIQPELLSSVGAGPYGSYDTPAESFSDDNAFQDFNFGTYYQPNMPVQPMLFGQQQMNPMNPAPHAPSFMPFTQNDSAAAFQPGNNSSGKARTRDSGYDTNMS